MKAIAVFEDTISRAVHLVDLYDLLHNRRTRAIRSSWAAKAKELLGWNASDNICRVDGEGAVLLIRDGDSWDMGHFDHAWLGELLRSALVSAVSAMDRYLHDVVADMFIRLLKKNTPKELARFSIPLETVECVLRKALETRKGGAATRPRTILKDKFRAELNQKTFQGAAQVEVALRMAGVSGSWGEIGKKMGARAEQVRKQLNGIVARRNKIAHEGDIKHGSRPREIKLNDIVSSDVRAEIAWLEKLVRTVDSLVSTKPRQLRFVRGKGTGES